MPCRMGRGEATAFGFDRIAGSISRKSSDSFRNNACSATSLKFERMFSMYCRDRAKEPVRNTNVPMVMATARVRSSTTA